MLRHVFPFVMLALAVLMIVPVSAFHIYAQRPDGGPLVGTSTIRDAFFNSMNYLQNLEDMNVQVHGASLTLPPFGDASGQIGLSCQFPCSYFSNSAYGGVFTTPTAGSLSSGATDWRINSLTFKFLQISNGFDARMVAHIYSLVSQSPDAFPSASIAYSNTLRVNSGISTVDTIWNFTFSQFGGANLQPATLYFYDLELRDLISAGTLSMYGESGGSAGYGYYNGAWQRNFLTQPYSSIGLFSAKHYMVIKEYPALPLDFVSLHDDAPPDLTNHITAQTMALHELGMLRSVADFNFPYGCTTNTANPYADYFGTVSGAPDGGVYDASMGNTIEDQEWAGATHPGGLTADNCPTESPSTNGEPSISDFAASPNGDSKSTTCTGPTGVNTVLCSVYVTYLSPGTPTQRTDLIYQGVNLIGSIAPSTSGQVAGRFYQSGFQSFRYSTRHVSQMANKYYGYVLAPFNTASDNFTTKGQLIQNLLNDYGFGPDIYDPLFNADRNLADDYMSDTSSSGPYHDCYVFGSLPGASDSSNLNNIGIDYYPYRSSVCSNMPTTLNAYVNCETTGCSFGAPDYLYDALQAKHLMDKYGMGQIAAAETLINNICWDGNGPCINPWLNGAYSTVRQGAYLSAVVKLEELLGPTTTYMITGQGCQASKGCGSSYSGLLTQRVQDTASILSKLWIGAGPWSVNTSLCGSSLPGAYEDSSTGAQACSPLNIGGFMVGYTPGDAPYAFKNPRGTFLNLAEAAYCSTIITGSGCVNMPIETPFPVPTNAEATMVGMMGLLSYYKLMYIGDSLLYGRVNLNDLLSCNSRRGSGTGGSGNQALGAHGYAFMCDGNDDASMSLADVIRINNYYGTAYNLWPFTPDGTFESGTLTYSAVSPGGSSDAGIVYLGPNNALNDYDSYSLSLGDSAFQTTYVTQTFNPTMVYGAFSARFAFYVPLSFDQNTPAAFPILVFTAGQFQFLIQPSGLRFSGQPMQDCFKAIGEGGQYATLCRDSPFFNEGVPNTWNTATITRDGAGNVNMYVNGVQVLTYPSSTSVFGGFTLNVEKCSSIYFSPITCSGTTSDYYYIDGISFTQDQS